MSPSIDSAVLDSENNRSEWQGLLDIFASYHRHPLNAGVHLFATPLGIYGFLGLLSLLSPLLSATLILVYSVALFRRVPFAVSLSASSVLVILWYLSAVMDPGFWFCSGCMAVGFVLQELIHHLVDEPTYQSTYSNREGWFELYLAHVFYLLPLVLAAFWRADGSVFSGVVPRRRVLLKKLSASNEVSALETILSFVEGEKPPRDSTTRWNQSELGDREYQAVKLLGDSASIRESLVQLHGRWSVIDAIEVMNDVCVSGAIKQSSNEAATESPHIDGSFAIWPFCSVYRCLLAVTDDRRLTAHFLMEGLEYDIPYSHTLISGEVLAFDYNREIHYEAIDESIAIEEPTVLLRLHYVVYPKWFSFFGKLLARRSASCNESRPQLINSTVKETGSRSGHRARLYETVQRFAGWENCAYVLAMGLLSLVSGSLEFFLLSTGFIHYLLYIGTFADRENVSFGRFKRDSFFYKGVSSVPLAVLFFLHLTFEPFAFILILVGASLSSLAYYRLGTNLTMFGRELGWCESEEIKKFPYGTIPHPMNFGSALLMLGLFCMPELRSAYPWLFPMHIAFYVLHSLQEVLTRPAFVTEDE